MLRLRNIRAPNFWLAKLILTGCSSSSITGRASSTPAPNLGTFLKLFTRGGLKMEHTKIEVQVIESMVFEAADAQLRELSDFQLAFVGGGSAELTLG